MTAFNDTGPVQTASDIFGYVWETCKSLAGAAGGVLAQFAPLTDSFGGASDAGTALGDAFNGAAGIVGDVAPCSKSRASSPLYPPHCRGSASPTRPHPWPNGRSTRP